MKKMGKLALTREVEALWVVKCVCCCYHSANYARNLFNLILLIVTYWSIVPPSIMKEIKNNDTKATQGIEVGYFSPAKGVIQS